LPLDTEVQPHTAFVPEPINRDTYPVHAEGHNCVEILLVEILLDIAFSSVLNRRASVVCSS